MVAGLLEGAPGAEAVRARVQERAAALAARGKTVGLATVRVGDGTASAGCVREKHEACAAEGMASHHHRVPASGSQGDLLALVDRLNAVVHRENPGATR